jgi:hypothetical protein
VSSRGSLFNIRSKSSSNNHVVNSKLSSKDACSILCSILNSNRAVCSNFCLNFSSNGFGVAKPKTLILIAIRTSKYQFEQLDISVRGYSNGLLAIQTERSEFHYK